MIEENDIRAQVANYLSGSQSLDEFEDWFVKQSWNMHQDSENSAQQLVGKIELALSEYSNNHVSEEAFRSQLRRLASTYFVTMGAASPQYDLVGTSTSVTQRPLVGIQLVAVS